MDETPTTRPSLLVRLQNPRDEQAWAEFVRIYTPLIERLARCKGMQEADAADLVQEVLRAVTRAMENQAFDPERGSFRGWLFRIARNLLINLLVSQGRQARGTGDTAVQDFLEAQPAASAEDSALFDAEYRRQLLYCAAEQVREEFTELSWQAFWLTGVEGRAAKDVAGMLGTTVGTVYHYKGRVMARLREKIGEIEGES
jgi:RNA polymerase sigma-70 factor (ECF subfamily)